MRCGAGAGDVGAYAEAEGSAVDGVLQLTDRHFDAAMEDLVLGGGELTRNLLGFAAGQGESPEQSGEGE